MLLREGNLIFEHKRTSFVKLYSCPEWPYR